LNKYYAYDHAPVNFEFTQSVERFHVEEIPPYRFSGSGNFLVLKIKKQDISTWKLIHVITTATGLAERDIGYAGLKDKNATAIQYISIPREAEKSLANIKTPKIEILEKYYNKAPIKIGHLKGNSFVIRLHDVNPKDAPLIEKIATDMSRKGIPNYFGYQRFGEDRASFEQGKIIAQSGKRLKGAKEKLLVASYQGYLFNEWLHQRVKISHIIATETPDKAAKTLSFPPALVRELAKEPQFFKLFLGDLMQGYPEGKLSALRDMQNDSKGFMERKTAPTGLICGSHVQRATVDAYHLEEPYDDSEVGTMRGDRRLAWIWPKDVATKYDAAGRVLQIAFTLPKGSYATTFLEEISKKELHPEPKKLHK